MRTHIIAVTALAGSMLLGPFMLGPSQAGRSPDFKSAVGATHTHAVSAGGSTGGRVGAQASASPAGRHYTSPSDRGEPAGKGTKISPIAVNSLTGPITATHRKGIRWSRSTRDGVTSKAECLFTKAADRARS
jgi:hypothetical protein